MNVIKERISQVGGSLEFEFTGEKRMDGYRSFRVKVFIPVREAIAS
ncbi:MAG: hypothetical protein ACOH5I_24180 [Oligoflexus sp.]